jgi:demethylmenaquinone methyltransferase/2-methoxy-6-polyprenyl-1,4-benzoquinol methylase
VASIGRDGVTSAALTARTRHARELFAGIAPQYEWMGAVWSFGQDARWRRFMISTLDVSRGSRMLDVATGTGLVARELAARGADVVQVDPSEPMLRVAAATDRRRKTRQMSAVLARAEDLPFPDGTFDGLTFTYLLRYVDEPATTVREMARVVRPGGRVASLEFHVPESSWAATVWRLYTRHVMPLVGAAVSPSWAATGRFLGPSVEEFYGAHPLAHHLAWWNDGGLDDVRARTLSNGAAVVTWGRKR